MPYNLPMSINKKNTKETFENPAFLAKNLILLNH